jgi:hypothetical protein
LCLADGAHDKPDFWTGLPAHVTALVRTAKNRALWHFPQPENQPLSPSFSPLLQKTRPHLEAVLHDFLISAREFPTLVT